MPKEQIKAQGRSAVTVNLDPAVKAELERRAEQECRTVSGQINFFVRAGLESQPRPAAAA